MSTLYRRVCPSSEVAGHFVSASQAVIEREPPASDRRHAAPLSETGRRPWTLSRKSR